MTRSPLFNFLAGIVAGATLATIIVLHIVTNQVQAHAAEVGDSFQRLHEESTKREAILQQTADAWQARAEKCEVKERMATVLYESQSETLPVLAWHGATFAVSFGNQSKPVWVIPAQVPVYANIPGAQYEWIDGKTGASIGRFPAVPSPAASVQ